MKNQPDANSNPSKELLIVISWISILFVSDVPDIICQSILGSVPEHFVLYKTGFLVFFLGLCLLWKKLRPLLPYAVIMLVLFAALSLSDFVRTSSWWAGLVSADETSFFLGNIRPYLRKAAVGVVVILALWLIFRNRRAFFLAIGQLNAPIEPIRWLGIKTGSWSFFGWFFAVCAAVAVAIPTFLSMKLPAGALAGAVKALPAVLFLAALNAFAEEAIFRLPLLSTLPKVIGKNQALLINAALFGLAHYLYGSPSGIIGFLMTGFLAWIMGKSLLETKGFFWPWFIHFLPDCVIFFSYALLWNAG